MRPRKTWHKCLSNHHRALELSHMVSQTSQSEFWIPRTVMILPSQCVRLNVKSLGYIPAQLWPKGSHNSCLVNSVFNGTMLMAKKPVITRLFTLLKQVSAQSKAFPCPTSDNYPLQSYSVSLVTIQLCAQAADLHFLTEQLLFLTLVPHAPPSQCSQIQYSLLLANQRTRKRSPERLLCARHFSDGR